MENTKQKLCKAINDIFAEAERTGNYKHINEKITQKAKEIWTRKTNEEFKREYGCGITKAARRIMMEEVILKIDEGKIAPPCKVDENICGIPSFLRQVRDDYGTKDLSEIADKIKKEGPFRKRLMGKVVVHSFPIYDIGDCEVSEWFLNYGGESIIARIERAPNEETALRNYFGAQYDTRIANGEGNAIDLLFYCAFFWWRAVESLSNRIPYFEQKKFKDISKMSLVDPQLLYYEADELYPIEARRILSLFLHQIDEPKKLYIQISSFLSNFLV